jgi:predicted aspartyl protease
MDVLTFAVPFDKCPQRVVTSLTIQQSLLYCSIKKLESHKAEIKALWDTGANGCCISRRIASNLSMTPYMNQEVTTFHGTSTAPVFAIDVILPDGKSIVTVPATAFNATREYDVIIGMDIITMGDMSLKHYQGKEMFLFSLLGNSQSLDYSAFDA